MAGAPHGGAETAYVDTSIAFHEAGQDVLAVTRPNKIRIPRLKKAGIPVQTLPFGGNIDFWTPYRLKKIIEEFEPDIVMTWMARAAAKIPNRRHVKTQKNYQIVSRLGGYYKLKNFKNTDFFTVITPDLKRHVLENGIPADKITLIPNFADTEEVITPIRKSDFDTPEDAPVLLTLARLHENKALDVVIKALKDLPGTYLWLAGEGPLRAELEKLAQDCSVQERVRFLGWRNDRAALLQACDICVFCSRVEPFGAVFLQAWANQTPVIVSDADGPRQIVRHGEDALMILRDDAGALVQAVQNLQNDQTLAKTLTQNGYDRYQKEFTRDAVIREYLAFFEAVQGSQNKSDKD